ncbi:uncharacterized protein [Aristolochia californica]|uniref:uncharacterized protein n=1 Tax=Aristolochia californica TaxID=171875 RepID=UPI0035D84B25
MAGLLLVRRSPCQLVASSLCIWNTRSLHSTSFKETNDEDKMKSLPTSRHHAIGTHLSSLLPFSRDYLHDLKIDLVDPDLWRVSSVLSEVWKEKEKPLEASVTRAGELDNYDHILEEDPNIDDIEDMRLNGNLFYKLEKNSIEFEEFNFSFRRKTSSRNKEKTSQIKANKDDPKTGKPQMNKEKNKSCPAPTHINGNVLAETKKRLRVLTYNQLTGPYHEPFCLDIYISKSSVRACIVHRVTSKVVAVAHSISKDMKFDLGSKKDSSACVAVGGILAQRAIADDIYNVVYTPRKGEKIEGKLKIVLQSIVDGGIDVKLKIKQRRPIKVRETQASGILCHMR